MKISAITTKQIIASAILVVSIPGPLASQEKNPIISSNAFLKLANEAMAVREKRLLNEAGFLECVSQPGTVILDARSKDKYDELHVKGAIHLNFSDFNEESLRKIIPNKDTRVLIYCNNNFKVEAIENNEAISREELERSMAVKTLMPATELTDKTNQNREAITREELEKSMAVKTEDVAFVKENETPAKDKEISKHVLPEELEKSMPVKTRKGIFIEDEGKSIGQGSLALNLPTYLTLFGYGYSNIYELEPLIDINKTKIALAGNLIDKKTKNEGSSNSDVQLIGPK